MSDRARLAALAAFIVIAAACVTIWAPHSADALRDRFDDLGVVGPPLFLCFSIPLVAAFFPGPLAAGAAGLLSAPRAARPWRLWEASARRHCRS